MEEGITQATPNSNSDSHSYLFKLFVIAVAVLVGFAAGHVITKDVYIKKISQISLMNMEKAVAIDTLNQEVKVLGAQTQAKK